jgi:streptogramin lyase
LHRFRRVQKKRDEGVFFTIKGSNALAKEDYEAGAVEVFAVETGDYPEGQTRRQTS